MARKFTNAQIAAMSDMELNDRLMVATQHGEALDDSTGSPLPWYLDPWAWPRRRKVNDLLGNPPRPWPPTYCSVAAACSSACTAVGTTYDNDLTPRQNAEAALVYHDTATA